jgi:N-formylmaleamate deformylase
LSVVALGRARDRDAVAPTSRFVRANGLFLHVRRYGSGPDVLVLPGITSPAATWDFAARRLAAGRRVWVLDLRGRGLSGAAGAGSGYRLADYAGDAAGVIAELGLQRPALLGHSVGARAAAALALGAPDRVGPVILVEPPLSGPGRAPYPLALDFYLEAIRRARAGRVTSHLRRLEPHWPDERLRDRARWLATCDERAVAESHANLDREDFLGLWRRLEGPALIHGGRSPVVTADGVAELRRTNPSARLIAVPDAGHMVPWDDLEGFLSAVDPLLDHAQRMGDGDDRAAGT